MVEVFDRIRKLSKVTGENIVMAQSLSELDKLLQSVNKEYGDGSVMRISGQKGINKVPRWDLSSLGISYVMGGGLPKGRIIEVYGAESSGKTSLACYLLGQIQQQGKDVLYIDAENALDIDYAETMGLNINEAIIAQPNSGEDALNIAQKFSESGLVGGIVIDSVSALTPKAELEGTMDDQQIGLQARMLGKACRKLAGILNKNQVTLIFINQTRVKIGGFSPYGEPTTTSGGKALRFYSSIRLETKARDRITEKDNHIGLVSKIIARKNKTAPPMREYELRILFGKGYQIEEEYIDFALKYDVFEKRGAWYYYTFNEEEMKFQGKNSVIEWLSENEDAFEEIKVKVDKAMNPVLVEEEVIVEESVEESVDEVTEENSEEEFYEDVIDELPDEE